MTLSLKKSDLVAVGFSVAYESGQAFKMPSAMKGVEKLAYNVLGRMAVDQIEQDFGIPEQINKKDLFTGAVAFIDNMARKGKSARMSAMEGFKEGISSTLGRYLVKTAGLDDELY